MYRASANREVDHLHLKNLMDETTIKLIEQNLGVKVNYGAFVVTWVILSWLGSRVKKLPSIPNDFIPAVLTAFGGLVYVSTAWLLGIQFEKSQLLVGCASGFFAVGAHQFLQRTKQVISGEPPKDPPVTTP